MKKPLPSFWRIKTDKEMKRRKPLDVIKPGVNNEPTPKPVLKLVPKIEKVKEEKKMSLLDKVVTGKQIGPQIHVVAGQNGVGKTTFAASFPVPLILDLEGGSNHLDVSRIPSDELKTLDQVRNAIKELASIKHKYKTIVIDSIESLEGLISDFVCVEGRVETIEKYDGGYGKGYTRTREIMREIMSDLSFLKTKGITIVLIAHTQTKQHSDPVTNQTYDRVIMRCNDKMAAIIRDLADNVFYATYKVFTATEKGKTKAFGDGQRVLYTQWRPAYDAKNRLDLPLEIPLSYDAFAEACTHNPESVPSDLISEIKEISLNLNENMKKLVSEQVEKFKNNPAKLKEVKNRLMNYTVK